MDASLHPAQPADTAPSPLSAPAADVPVIDSVELMNGTRELRIRHGVNLYRLRVTASDKLILTK